MHSSMSLGLSQKTTVFALDEVLDQLAEESRVQALRKDLDFRYVPCARMVQTDRHLLARVLRNFLSNALRYIAEGRVLLGCRRDPSGIRIEVWDTGPGIPAEEQEAIFVAFHRVAVAVPPAEQNGGLGLGLSSARISDPQRRCCCSTPSPLFCSPCSAPPARASA
jgi:signal transduction histidine kinase